MSSAERVYSVLIVSSADNFNNALAEMLPASRFDIIRKAASVNAARRLLADRSYDLIIINSPLPDDAGVRFAIDSCESGGAIVLFLAWANRLSDVSSRLGSHGVFTAQKPISRAMLENALDWMTSARERVRKLEKKTMSIEEKMEEIRFVNRAKWLLMSELKMDEPDAHRYIEKQAMDRCVTRREIAEGIIKTYS